jgi:H+/Cl- antiporter ClcA
VATEREAKAKLGELRLTGRRQLAQRWLLAVMLGLAVIGLISYLLPAHEVYDTGALDGLGCAFIPDCDPSVLIDDNPGQGEPDVVDSIYDHGGPIPIVLFAVIAGLAVLYLERPRLGCGVAAFLGSLATLAGVLLLEFNLDHMFDHVRQLPASYLHGGALVGLVGLASLGTVVTVVLHLRERRSRAADAR